jgi:hypothetical protein
MIIDVKRQQQKTAPVHHICVMMMATHKAEGGGFTIWKNTKKTMMMMRHKFYKTLGDKIVFHLYKLICRSLLIGFLHVR